MSVQKSKEYQQTADYKNKIKEGQLAWRDSLYGPETEHTKVCESCNKPFSWFGRKGTKKYERTRFCSTSCAHSRADYWNDNATRYQTIAFKHHKRKCVICEETNILDVHHLDENRENNDPSNLIPLCPTHHRYWHSRYKHLIEKDVLEYIEQWKKQQ